MKPIKQVVLLINSTRQYGRNLIRGVARYSRLHGPWLFHTEVGMARWPETTAAWPAVDGMIVQSGFAETAEEVIPAGMPAVVVSDRHVIPGYPNVVDAWETTGALAAEHLLNLGFRHFAFCGWQGFTWSQRRADAFAQRIAENADPVAVYAPSYPPSGSDWGRQQDTLLAWLKQLPRPVAVMACNDDRARHVLEACRTGGLAVPDEVAVLGVDNDETVCELTYPPLSSVAVNAQRAGFEAAEVLARMMGGEAVGAPLIRVAPLHVEARHSTDVLAIDDQDVAEAVRFIRQHARRHLSVTEVVEAVAVSRRILERRFTQVLGRSLHQEIRRVRVEEIARLLTETALPVGRIADMLDYAGPEHVARFFRQEKGVSPNAYRRQMRGS